jgi:hypothetical protein
MRTEKIKSMAYAILLLISLMLITTAQSVWAQELVDPVAQYLTRGKMWISSHASADAVLSSFGFEIAYPGYASTSTTANNYGKPSVRVIGKKGGEDLIGGGGHFGAGNTWFSLADKQNTVVKNYNFVNSLSEPEEYVYGEVITIDPNPSDDNFPLIYQTKTKRMAWSLPKYDDFVITQVTLLNRDSDTFTDFYFTIQSIMTPTRGGFDKGYKNDTEYVWDEDINAFIFYDDTSWEYGAASPIVYNISPGDVSGDRGDPGNIREVGSIDRKLYSPQAIADAFVECTPNKFGEQKFWYEIRNSVDDLSGFSVDTAPAFEQFNAQDLSYDKMLGVITTEAPKMSWREANAQGIVGAGNTYERTPLVFSSLGPYDIAPGDSIEFTMITCGGDMDRNITMKGGTEATAALPDGSIAELKQNWQAAMSLYEGWQATGDWNANISAYPPPTVGNAPLVANEDELEVSVFAEAGEGGSASSQGYEIAWLPVPGDYADPISGSNDLAGYYIYRSEIGIEGPWDRVATVSKSEADNMIGEDGKVYFRLTSEPGIPSRFAVTSYDTEGLESGMTAYNFFPLAAERAPSNDLSSIYVVPNPFKQVSGLLDTGEEKRLAFVNIPSKCTIRIYTVAGELVQTVPHEGFGEETWGSSTGNNYMLTRFAMNVMPGVYYYHIESQVSGHEGETSTGKFVIIK